MPTRRLLEPPPVGDHGGHVLFVYSADPGSSSHDNLRLLTLPVS